MKKSFFLLLISFTSFLGYCQDIIYIKSSKDSIISRIEEVNIENVKYRKFSNLTGPLYTIEKSKIDKIIYNNGDIEDYKMEETKIPKNFATVYVIRPKTGPTSYLMNGMGIYENDKIICVLKSNTYFSWKINVNDGEISISSKGEGKDVLRIFPKYGKTYYIKLSHKTGWVKARPKLEFIDEDEAKKLLKKTSIAESKIAE